MQRWIRISLLLLLPAVTHAYEVVNFEREVRLSSKYYIDVEGAADGGFFVLDGRQMRVERYDRDGKLRSTIGKKGRARGEIVRATSIAVAADDTLYVADSGTAEIHRYAPDGTYQGSFGGKGKALGLLTSPVALAICRRGFVYVADAGRNAVARYTPEGIYLDAFLLEGGPVFELSAGPAGEVIAMARDARGPLEYNFVSASAKQLPGPRLSSGVTGLFINSAGALYLVNSGKARLQQHGRDGKQTASFGSKGAGRGQFRSPTRVSGDGGNRLFVLDSGNARVQVLEFGNKPSNSLPGVSRAMTVRLEESAKLQADAVDIEYTDEQRAVLVRKSGRIVIDGAQTQVLGRAGSGRGELKSPEGFGIAPTGDIFVADTLNHRVHVFTQDGSSFTFGGRGRDSGQFSSPKDVAVDSRGFVYVADTGNHRVQVFTSQGIWVSQIGEKSAVKRGEKAPLGTFNSPNALAVDRQDRVHVLDSGNLRVQMFDSNGGLVGGFALPSNVTAAKAIAVDELDRTYVADSGLSRVLIFRNGQQVFKFGSSGTGAGSLPGISGLAVGNDLVHVVDRRGHRLTYRLTNTGGVAARVGDQREQLEWEYFVPNDAPKAEQSAYRELALGQAIAELANNLGVEVEAIEEAVRVEQDTVGADGEARLIISAVRPTKATSATKTTRPARKELSEELELR